MRRRRGPPRCRSASSDQLFVRNLACRGHDQVAAPDIAARASRAGPRASPGGCSAHRRGSSARVAGRRRTPPTARRRSGRTGYRRLRRAPASTTSFSRSRSLRGEMRPQDQVGDELERERHMLGHHRGRVRRGVALGAGVELTADILDRFVELACRTAARALEHHMLEQVREAVEMLRLIARAARAQTGRPTPFPAPGISRLTTRRPLSRMVSFIIAAASLPSVACARAST